MKRTGSQAIWEALVGEGVETVFGYPGGAIMPAYDALPGYPTIRHVLVRHEQGAAHMADGFARASGKVGVAIATSGPGATNLVTGIATAMMDSSPMVCITGQVSSAVLGTDAFQETDITGVTLPITKHNYLVTRAEEIYPTLREAFHLARSGRPGPVHVDITKDAQQASFELRPEEGPVPRSGRKLRPSPPADLDRAAALIDAAERPLVLSGHGIVRSGASDLLVEFAEKTGCPVASTLLGLGGFPASHPLSLGMMGMHGEAWVNKAIQDADLLIALGMRFDDRVTGKLSTYAQNARKIHVEIDPSEINKNVKVDVALMGDAAWAVRELTGRVRSQKRSAWSSRISEMKGDSAVRDIQSLPHSGRLFAAHVLHDLWRLTSGRALVVTDVGQHQMWEAQYYKHERPRSLITSGGLGTMGFALPAAIGVKVARPGSEVWVVVGDGGFQMTMAELATVVQENLKVNIAVINNGYLGMVRQWQEFFYERNYQATPLLNPDFVKLAEAYGIRSMAVTQRSEVVPAVQAARRHDGPVLINFKVEQEDTVYPMVAAGASLHEMIRRPSPIVAPASAE